MYAMFSLYTISLFLHIVGALGLFVTLALEWAGLSNLRRAATAGQAREWLNLLASLRRLHPIVWFAILIPGFYMAAVAWRGVDWIRIALAAIVLLFILAFGLGRGRMAAIAAAAAAEEGLLSTGLRQQLKDPLLWASLCTRTAISMGIVFLMAVKPGLLGSLLTIGAAIVLGLAYSLPAWDRDRENVQPRQAPQ